MSNLKSEIIQAKIKLDQLEQEYHAIPVTAQYKQALKDKLAEIVGSRWSNPEYINSCGSSCGHGYFIKFPSGSIMEIGKVTVSEYLKEEPSVDQLL